jgi:hypothetical protein
MDPVREERSDVRGLNVREVRRTAARAGRATVSLVWVGRAINDDLLSSPD